MQSMKASGQVFNTAAASPQRIWLSLTLESGEAAAVLMDCILQDEFAGKNHTRRRGSGEQGTAKQSKDTKGSSQESARLLFRLFCLFCGFSSGSYKFDGYIRSGALIPGTSRYVSSNVSTGMPKDMTFRSSFFAKSPIGHTTRSTSSKASSESARISHNGFSAGSACQS